ncbi:MAG: toxin-activating lysine-acyltransferase [Alphaproteobacteria bacterium]|nr:toxin-activating lysine-acyltransferase [Alphaproteobacteria bacterium]
MGTSSPLPKLRPVPSHWQSGPNLWLIDLVCPFGDIAEAAQQLREETFRGREVKTVRAKADGANFAIGT